LTTWKPLPEPVEATPSARSRRRPFRWDGGEALALAVPDETGAILEGALFLPPARHGPWPLMLFLHGSGGLMRWHARYRDLLLAEGIAVAAFDHFGARGIVSTVSDQERLSSEAMARDALAARTSFAADPRIDPSRIAMMGVSKGGSAAWRASLLRFGADPARPFALHLGLYPGCETRYFDLRSTGAPVLMIAGGQDDYTGCPPCRDLVAALNNAGGSAELVELPHARHGWDSGAAAWHEPTGVSYAPCRFVEVAPGEWRETSTGLTWAQGDLAGRRAAVEACRRTGVGGAGDPGARASSDALLLCAVRRHLQKPPVT